MIYISSDHHGFPLNRFLRMLKKVHFSAADKLYILGDVIDRNGDGGVQTLRWIIRQSNVKMLMGNHEDMLLRCKWFFDDVDSGKPGYMDTEQILSLRQWLTNGGEVTISNLKELQHRDEGELWAILQYLEELPLYERLSTAGRTFNLVHAGLGNYSPEKALSDYTKEELLWYRPQPGERFDEKMLTILGHTPSVYYGVKDRMVQTETWVDVDTGAAGCGAPMLLRLEDMQAFYER